MSLPDPSQLGARFDRLAAGSAVLHEEIGARLLERLDLVKISPRQILDVGCGNGAHARLLARKYAGATIFCIDRSENMARAVVAERSGLRSLLRRSRVLASVADAHLLPVEQESTELVFANLLLHWSSDPMALMSEIYRVLKENSLFVFSCYGPDSLQELAAIDIDVPGFSDMHDLGDTALAAGFSDPVMEMEKLSLKYKSRSRLCGDIEAAGLLNEQQILQIRQHPAADLFENFSLTIEVVYGHAWKPEKAPDADTFKGIKIKPVLGA